VRLKILAVSLLFVAGVTQAQTPASVPTAQVSAPEPFGFKEGMSKAEVIASVGREAVISDRGDTLTLNTAPVPHPDFHLYSVAISPSVGLSKVITSEIVRSSDFGAKVKIKFSELQTALETKYGTPSKVFDFLQAGSSWQEPQEWMMGLAKGDRYLAAFWELPGGGTVLLDVTSTGRTDSAYIYVRYDFANADVWQKEHDTNRYAPLSFRFRRVSATAYIERRALPGAQ
jgi:hypothetical protein